MTKTFRPYSLDQQLLLPPDLRGWLPEGDLALFVSDVVDELDLSAIYAGYESGEGRGQPPYHPGMMVKLLLYGYCIGTTSSRKIERAKAQVACGVTQAAADVGQFVPMLDQVAAHLGQLPAQVTADAGYFSEANLTAPQFGAIDFYVPPDRHPHGRDAAAGRSRQGPCSEAMRSKRQTAAGRAVYARRKTIPEPVFGEIKQGRGFRRFWLRGLRKVRGEWTLICLTHNLLKLFRAQAGPLPA